MRSAISSSCVVLLIALLGMNACSNEAGVDVSEEMKWALGKSPVTGLCYEFAHDKYDNRKMNGMSEIPCSEFERLTK